MSEFPVVLFVQKLEALARAVKNGLGVRFPFHHTPRAEPVPRDETARPFCDMGGKASEPELADGRLMTALSLPSICENFRAAVGDSVQRRIGGSILHLMQDA
ncbi:hypothetical protein AB0M44_44320 [Streptosporangium subroseum]|uniref:hypothetical protein n=1 Tax=Streptosporangium subroseum TaxID=106412 RepID=UPI0034302C96